MLVLGGAFNGKLKYVKDKYSLKDEEIYYCKSDEINLEKKVISGFHIFIREMLINNKDAIKYIEENKELLKEKILIADDINSGIVPIDKFDRKWRDVNGKALQILSKENTKVIRVFFGLEMVLKDE
ncbi:bifunctional adenosylcobinamide kinase/adenosylcobinamide-phosphate guanylyltransferase [Clostridium sp.]|uniref:bifunctional adenosylcobinamide kinase/adenosylcobinamide-phosphate guanylyltransferase n=1 Tax=Clostridium sp. TaxID=1506 RepID=UPI0026DD6C8F|nr:bifunctional adenosylcobinamide kinase/adenosylcobinamide-phosphate guanylyltransferase [Clostridium sp.]MDO5038236.1 bifunctional adenosylcobinamide kinase/adenosylcobinamide-phosphate guanylyltransferase [Clostridium sp.]